MLIRRTYIRTYVGILSILKPNYLLIIKKNKNSFVTISLAMSQRSKKWSKEHDALLLSLFQKQPSKGGILASDTSKNTIKAIINKHFPDRQYSSFSQLFRRKAREFLINQTLAGTRDDNKGQTGQGK